MNYNPRNFARARLSKYVTWPNSAQLKLGNIPEYSSIFRTVHVAKNNMLGYLSWDIICSSKLTVFLELPSWKAVCLSEQIMAVDKYPSIFSCQMEAIVYITTDMKKFHSWIVCEYLWLYRYIFGSANVLWIGSLSLSLFGLDAVEMYSGLLAVLSQYLLIPNDFNPVGSTSNHSEKEVHRKYWKLAGVQESNLVDTSYTDLPSKTLHIVRKLKYLLIPCICLDPSISFTTF